MAVPKGIYIIGAKSTPFGRYGGVLSNVTASQIYAAAARDAIACANISPTNIDNIVIGNVHFLSQCDGGKTSRYSGTYSGLPLDKPALTVNKENGSGLQAIINSALDILTGAAKVSLTGGTENMSSLPHLARNVRFGTVLGGKYSLDEYIGKLTLDNRGLTTKMIANAISLKYNISREEADAYSLESRKKWKKAQDSNRFKEELTSITVDTDKDPLEVTKDEIADVNESLELLPAIGRVTVGNTATPGDGAAALILANEESLKKFQLSPLGRLAGWSCVGGEPKNGLGAVAAVRKLLDATRTMIGEIDLIEVNESYACEILAFVHELGVEISKVNVSGGGLAIGCPTGASAARSAVHLTHLLRQHNMKKGIVASDVGFGQGVAIMIETV